MHPHSEMGVAMANYTDQERLEMHRVWQETYQTYRKTGPSLFAEGQKEESVFSLQAQRDFTAQSVMLLDAYMDGLTDSIDRYVRAAKWTSIAIAVATVVYAGMFIWYVCHPPKSPPIIVHTQSPDK